MFHIIICHVMKVKQSVALGARGVAHTRSLKLQLLSFEQNLDPKWKECSIDNELNSLSQNAYYIITCHKILTYRI